jgi:hypothetical protein
MNTNKLILIVFVAFCISILGFSKSIFAIPKPVSTQFGGRILTSRTSPVICNAQYGPVAVIPASGSKNPGLLNVIVSDQKINPGGQILGYYEKTPDMKTCYIQAGPYRIPVPTYKIKAGNFKTSIY